ncbi:MAG: hypothetical protein HOP02_00580 [Methylococcaceae bacterium]|nr:hypothetical protein [Methylococcaceae bacterium]
MIVFYPIKPVYSKKILDGEKIYELRKRLPSKYFDYVLIYSTTPVAKVVAYAKVKAVHRKKTDELWEMVSTFSGINKEDYMSYFDGNDYACAIELEDIKRFKRPFDVKEISLLFKVPQSFCYINRKDFNRLKRRKTESV